MISFQLYNTLPFLREKIDKQFEIALENDGDKFSPDRFGALMFDLNYIEKNTIICITNFRVYNTTSN